MKIPLKNRRKIHALLFISFIIVQLIILFLWYSQTKNENNLSKIFENASKPNKALLYTNLATTNYFKAEYHFNKYFQKYDENELKEYKIAVDSMTTYLDSLNKLTANNPNIKLPLELKRSTEINIFNLRKDLDSVINSGVNKFQLDENNFVKFNKYDSEKVLASIKFDTIRLTNKAVKKGILARIAQAISGKYNLKRDELRIYISMLYDNKRNTYTVEEQLKNIFESTNNYYIKEFDKLKNINSDLRTKNNKLLDINYNLISNCQEAILFYNGLKKGKNAYNFINQSKEINGQRSLIFNLLTLLLVLTFLIIAYSIFAYIYEKELIVTKTELEKNLDFKNQIIGMLSHEIRAPINIISNTSDKIKINNQNSELEETINTLNFTSNSLQITVNQILNFIKSENSKLVLYKSNLNLLQEIKAITSSIQSLIDAKKLKLITKINSNLDINVWADNGKIHQLFYNIIGNAIKFTDKGSITLTCKTENLDQKIKFSVTIKDTGIGIPKDDVSHIFDKFYQSKATDAKISLGAGLGLNLCKEIVELHHGEIDVFSEINQGTEISFYIILEKENDENQTNKAKLKNIIKDKNLKIAFVDDDILITTILKKIIQDIGIEAIAFTSANEILNYLKKNNVDLVITDLEISGFSGKDLALNIKTLKNKNSEVPIIAITGDNYMETIDISTIGMDEIIIKPIDREEFYAKLLRFVDK